MIKKDTASHRQFTSFKKCVVVKYVKLNLLYTWGMKNKVVN